MTTDNTPTDRAGVRPAVMTASENAARVVATKRVFNADVTRGLNGLSAAMDATCKAMTAYLAAGSPTMRWNPHQKRWGMVRRG